LKYEEATMKNANTTPIKILSNKEVRLRIPYSSVQIWRKENAGEFPRRVKLGANRIGWIESEIENWIASKIGERKL
jgi:prophage regulatory protein